MINKIKEFFAKKRAKKARAQNFARYLNSIGNNFQIVQFSDIVMPDGSFDYLTVRVREKHRPVWNKGVKKLTPFQIYVKNREHETI